MMGVFQHISDQIVIAYYVHMLKASWPSSYDTMNEQVEVPEYHGRALHYARKLIEVDVPAVPALIRLLKDENPLVRGFALWALRDIAETNAEVAGTVVPLLFDALKDENPKVRHTASWGIWRKAKMNPENEALVKESHRLVNVLRDKDSQVAYWSAPALRMILDRCDSMGQLEIIEKSLMGLATEIRNERTHMDVLSEIAVLMNRAAARKNELAQKEMEAGGLILAGERPRPPKKDDGMYREICTRGRVKHG